MGGGGFFMGGGGIVDGRWDWGSVAHKSFCYRCNMNK
jgi:hypothetical protein